ncbi:hypothetical protein B0H14DRAFT_3467689 [Mycena olivaceomarginata]|nr:hypothetical protein B0H14DRAFT_3467689 [Mycena olivaceomarginata]
MSLPPHALHLHLVPPLRLISVPSQPLRNSSPLPLPILLCVRSNSLLIPPPHHLRFVNYLTPRGSLADKHFMFSRVESIPAVLWWTPLTVLVFFGFFGFVVEAWKHLRLSADGLENPYSSIIAQGLQLNVR